jgi:hypothetical protein
MSRHFQSVDFAVVGRAKRSATQDVQSTRDREVAGMGSPRQISDGA